MVQRGGGDPHQRPAGGRAGVRPFADLQVGQRIVAPVSGGVGGAHGPRR